MKPRTSKSCVNCVVSQTWPCCASRRLRSLVGSWDSTVPLIDVSRLRRISSISSVCHACTITILPLSVCLAALVQGDVFGCRDARQQGSIPVFPQPWADQERECVRFFLFFQQPARFAHRPDETRSKIRAGANHGDTIRLYRRTHFLGDPLNFQPKLLG